MSSFVFDIEANGLLDTVTNVWSIVLKDIITKEVFSYDVSNLNEGINKIQEAEVLIGHNIICYDVPVLEKLFGIKIHAKLMDTLLISRMVWPEIGMSADAKKKYNIPGNLFGSYSLEAFGYRLNLAKGSHVEWDKWSPEMQKYCIQDVEVTFKLWQTIGDKLPPIKALYIETEFQKFIHLQEQAGVYFNVEKALSLQKPLIERIAAITKELQTIIPPKIIKLPRSTKKIDFNPASRSQIIAYLCERYDWKPTQFTEKGNAQLSEDVLEALPYPEAKLFSEFFKTQKLVGMISEGDNSWLNYVKNGKLHGRVITLGAVTARCTHASPNLAQIPSPRSFMGKEVRELFYAPAGYTMVGTDASGLELRCFAHYLHQYDNGTYSDEVIHGDVHTRNMYAAGLTNRDDAKTFIYALLYGAGDEKLGAIKISGTPEQLKAEGRKMRYSFMDKVPAYRHLTVKIQDKLTANNNQITGIDGRILNVRHRHAALNTLLQNAGAVAMKLAAVKFRDNMDTAGIPFTPCLNVHDEFEVYVKDEYAEQTKIIAVKSIEEAGDDLGFKCKLTGQSRSGKTWYDVH
jgi:DNA polymerase I-like protein with 3'-5' exonuclease and polymerase domains